MSVIAEPRGYSKYAWREIARELPAKRSAAQRGRDYGEINLLYDEDTVREQASRCLNCPFPGCREGCPLGNRIPEWLALTAEGKFLEAAAVSRSTSNMPEICSRVCPQEKLCEGACILNGRSEPVSIGAIEKFINEYAFAREKPELPESPWRESRVAVIGSGPGGLACADELAKRGYSVTIFEAQNRAGGLLMNGIPGFKLEKAVVDRRVEVLRRRGITFALNTRVGRDVTFAALRAKYDAVFLGIGAQKAKPPDVPGAELNGVFPALPFLVEKNVPGNAAERIDVRGKRVAVLGGGDTAMDCLRTALRAGATEAVCIYRRDLENMPGSRKEYYNAIDEGARFQFLTNPVALQGSAGAVAGVQCVRMQLGKPDAQGRRQPEAIPGSEFSVPADMILVAYGFDPEPLPASVGLHDIAIDRWGAAKVDGHQMTNLPGIFAGGDLSRGASLVVHAVRDGRKAAEAIDQYLG
jgi:glutamate synthase (NADPH/NADH) small chain